MATIPTGADPFQNLTKSDGLDKPMMSSVSQEGSKKSVFDSENRVLLLIHQRGKTLANFLTIAGIAGAVLAFLWQGLVDLPTYKVGTGGVATINELDVTNFFQTDAIFAVIGIFAGLAFGITGWILFGRFGWPVVLVTVLAAIAGAGICWLLGSAIGPTNFAERISSAAPGDEIPINFQLRSPSAVLVWICSAMIPVIICSAISALLQVRNHAKDTKSYDKAQ